MHWWWWGCETTSGWGRASFPHAEWLNISYLQALQTPQCLKCVHCLNGFYIVCKLFFLHCFGSVLNFINNTISLKKKKVMILLGLYNDSDGKWWFMQVAPVSNSLKRGVSSPGLRLLLPAILGRETFDIRGTIKYNVQVLHGYESYFLLLSWECYTVLDLRQMHYTHWFISPTFCFIEETGDWWWNGILWKRTHTQHAPMQGEFYLLEPQQTCQ